MKSEIEKLKEELAKRNQLLMLTTNQYNSLLKQYNEVLKEGKMNNIFDECSPKELRILDFFAQSLEENPNALKEQLLKCSINDRARTLAFIQCRVPKLYQAIQELLQEEV